jgi:hypothetical protein
MIRVVINILAVAALAAAIEAVPSQAQETMTKDKLVGTWRMISFKAITGNQVTYPLGERPSGLIAYTPTRIWVMTIDSDRRPPASATLTDTEAVSLMKSHTAYTGKYDVDPAQTPDGIKIVIHADFASNQAIAGTDRAFFVRVDGNKLTIKSPAAVAPSTGLTSSVQVECVKAD